VIRVCHSTDKWSRKALRAPYRHDLPLPIARHSFIVVRFHHPVISQGSHLPVCSPSNYSGKAEIYYYYRLLIRPSSLSQQERKEDIAISLGSYLTVRQDGVTSGPHHKLFCPLFRRVLGDEYVHSQPLGEKRW
jgi:hypothetical protein